MSTRRRIWLKKRNALPVVARQTHSALKLDNKIQHDYNIAKRSCGSVEKYLKKANTGVLYR